MVSLFFSPQGRIGKGQFWIGVIVLLVVGIGLSVAQRFSPQSVALVFALLSIVLIYPSVCVYVKRLHDAGKSGWWYLLVILIAFIANAIASVVLFAPYFSELAEMTPGSPELQARTQQITEVITLPLVGISLVISLGIALIVSMLPSDPGENRFGPSANGQGTAATFS
jgi:uncharacterized membrane protein YhaH (DUF805 family)